MLIASCGGPSVPSAAGDGQNAASAEGANLAASSSGGDASPFAQVQIADGAYVDADRQGGDEIKGVSFAEATSAVCTTGERIAVVPDRVDAADVEDWTNATEEPVVYVNPEDVQGDVSGLSSCSMAYEQDELDETVLHGHHMHAAHS